MVKFWVKYENKIALALGFILVALIAFGAGLLYQEEKSQSQEPLTLTTRDTTAAPLRLALEEIAEGQIHGRTDLDATVQIGNSTILTTDTQGNFSFTWGGGAPLMVYDAEHVITLDLSGINLATPGAASTPQSSTDNVLTGQGEQVPIQAPPPSSVSAAKTIPSNPAVPITGRFVGSKNSDKYHLPNCRSAKKIKPENQVWFSSQEEARSKDYQPCGICIK